jgi:hypothetical protein
MSQLADVVVVIAANALNLLLIGVFLARAADAQQLERQFGLLAVALVLPFALSALGNALAQRPWWAVALPLVAVAYLIVELILDYLLGLDFRHTVFLGPYLLLFYAAQWAVIGYAFAVDRVAGFVTLVTYFLCLGATAYSYSRVGHGRAVAGAAAGRH